jgi:hypothetical protein
MALKHEVPALAVTAQVSEGDFAELLDKRIAHLQELRRREVNGNGSTNKLIEATVEPEPVEPVEVKPTPTSMYRALNSRFNRRA